MYALELQRSSDRHTIISHDALNHREDIPGGCIDEITEAHVRGWCVDPRAPDDPVSLEFRFRELILAEFVTNEPREDIAAQFGTTSACGFCLNMTEIPSDQAKLALNEYANDLAAMSGQPCDLRVTIKGQDLELPRWSDAGSTFSNANFLYVLKSSVSQAEPVPSSPLYSIRVYNTDDVNSSDYFLRNIPAWEFRESLERIIDNKSFYLLRGVSQRVWDPTLGEEDLITLLFAVCRAGDPALIHSVVDALQITNRITSVPFALVCALCNLIQDKPLDGRAHNASIIPDIILSTINVEKDVVQRQKNLINALIQKIDRK